MNILLVDDHELFRAGIKFLLADLAESIEFSEAANCADALLLGEGRPFDIVLLDFHLPGVHGLEAVRAVHAKFENTMIVVLSAEEDSGLIRSVIDEGAAGFIPKASKHPVMVAALRLVLAGGIYLPPSAYLGSSGIGMRPPPGEDGSGLLKHLTKSQHNTLCLAVQGKSNKVIARELSIAEATVKAHLSAAYRVLGVRNRTEAVIATARLGIRLQRLS